LYLPIGSGIKVKNDGVEIAGSLWSPQIGYVTPEQYKRLLEVSTHMKGFTIHKGEEYSSAYPRVDNIYPGGDNITRLYGGGMFEVWCTVDDFKEALTSMKGNPVITCCPVCIDTERYISDDKYKDLYDMCSKYFLRYWYYGSI
jgi:hypothetical protein